MNVLFILFEFIPLNRAGVYRPLRFVNALASEGINPIVLTFDFKNSEEYQVDENLTNLLHPKVKIIKLSLDKIGYFTKNKMNRVRYVMNNYVGDNYLNVINKFHKNKIDKIIDLYSPKIIVSSCPPFSGAVLGRDLSLKYKIPFILDMRDAWSHWSNNPYPSYYHYIQRKKIETSVFKQATCITSVTPQLISKFKKTNPDILDSKFKLIYNSPNFQIEKSYKIIKKSIAEVERIHIGYTGSFYYRPQSKNRRLSIFKFHRLFQYHATKEDWFYRTPYFFLKALNKLFENRPSWKGKIFFNYVGKTESWFDNMINDLGLKDNVILHGYQSQSKVQELEKSFDILLTTSEKVINGEHYCLPSKLFTYLLAKKMIFGFVTEGVQKEFLEKSGIGIVFNPDNIDENVIKLENYFSSSFENNIELTEFIQTYDSNNTSNQFINLINDIVENNNNLALSNSNQSEKSSFSY